MPRGARASKGRGHPLQSIAAVIHAGGVEERLKGAKQQRTSTLPLTENRGGVAILSAAMCCAQAARAQTARAAALKRAIVERRG